MKYTTVEIEILHKGGRKALEEYRKANRKPIAPAPRPIESKKYKEKYKEKLDNY